MQGSPGIDYPEDRSPVDVLAASRGDAVMSFVETVTDDELLVSIGQDRAGRPVRLRPVSGWRSSGRTPASSARCPSS